MLREGDLTGGRFRLIRRIGSGGMASVWWARHELLGRDVALKLSRVGPDEQVVARFLREARIIGKFQHRNIVGVVDAGVLHEEGYVFLAMELLHGASFASRLAPARPLPPSEVVPLLIEVCRGLEVAHAAGVVHRDMKPENIFLAETPGEGIVPKIVDFGISLLAESDEPITIEGQLLGTPAYMSPEQVRGERNIDARADVWALGVILHEALAGRQPFKSDGHHAVLWSIMDDAPAPLPASVDPALRAIVAKCLQKVRAHRYPDAAALREALEAALAGCGRAASAMYGSRRRGRAFGRSWAAIGFVGGVMAAVGLAAGAAQTAPLLAERSPADTPALQVRAVDELLEALLAVTEAASPSAGPPAVAREQAASDPTSADAVPRAEARDVVEQLPHTATRRRSRSVTRPGF